MPRGREELPKSTEHQHIGVPLRAAFLPKVYHHDKVDVVPCFTETAGRNCQKQRCWIAVVDYYGLRRQTIHQVIKLHLPNTAFV